jgi:hypothetical protein
MTLAIWLPEDAAAAGLPARTRALPAPLIPDRLPISTFCAIDSANPLPLSRLLYPAATCASSPCAQLPW